MVDDVIAVGNLAALTTMLPSIFKTELEQNGGGKIGFYKPRKSKTDEKYLRVSF